jgi:hypothetical protein
MTLWKRKLTLMAAVAAGALALALLGDVFGVGQVVTVAVAGLALALVIVVGGPWAFGEGRFALEDGDAMHSHQPAVVANDQQSGKGFPGDHFIYLQAMEDYLFVEGRPAVLSAGPAGSRGPFIEGETEFVEVGNGVGHGKDEY